MPKITLIGAGSHVFARRLIGDALTWPSLASSTICLMDLNQRKLDLMAALARKMVKTLGVAAQIEATTDLRTALRGADYVIVSIRVSDSDAHVSVPLKYGIDQAVGDTNGPGGAFYFLKNAPAVIQIAKMMQEECPHALMLNYTNPMVMLSWAVHLLAPIKFVGLCHSVQGTARDMARYAGIPFEEVTYWAAGINHMAWFLEFNWKKQDAYPLLFKAMQDPEIYAHDVVKFEVMKHFGAFVSESSIHCSEYLPYFRRTPELIDRYIKPTMWGVGAKGETREQRRARYAEQRAAAEAELVRLATTDDPLTVERSHEFCTYILNAIETNIPYSFNGNVWNTGLITNLLPNSVVEVPILVDGCGLHPCYVGDLPPALAALNRSNLAVQELVVKGFVEKDRECIYRAIQLDPLTASLLSLDDIRRMVDEMFAADAANITI